MSADQERKAAAAHDLLRRLYQDDDLGDASEESTKDSDSEFARMSEMRSVFAQMKQAADVEPPTRGVDALMAAAAMQASKRANGVAVRSMDANNANAAKPGLWTRVRNSLGVFSHPGAMVAAAALVVVAAAGTMYARRGSVDGGAHDEVAVPISISSTAPQASQDTTRVVSETTAAEQSTSGGLGTEREKDRGNSFEAAPDSPAGTVAARPGADKSPDIPPVTVTKSGKVPRGASPSVNAGATKAPPKDAWATSGTKSNRTVDSKPFDDDGAPTEAAGESEGKAAVASEKPAIDSVRVETTSPDSDGNKNARPEAPIQKQDVAPTREVSKESQLRAAVKQGNCKRAYQIYAEIKTADATLAVRLEKSGALSDCASKQAK
jgi:hypothetical protein